MTAMVPDRPLSEEIAGIWRHMGNVTRAVTVYEVRFDRIDADIAELKADVATLKTDVAALKTDVAALKTDVAALKTDVAELKVEVRATKEQLNRLEQSTERGFRRIDAQFEQLVALIKRDEFKK
jgi:chromosome segregation ATPase